VYQLLQFEVGHYVVEGEDWLENVAGSSEYVNKAI
jgi:hypothetical protein